MSPKLSMLNAHPSLIFAHILATLAQIVTPIFGTKSITPSEILIIQDVPNQNMKVYKSLC